MPWPTIYDTKLDEYDAMELPGQQLASAHAVSPLDHLLNMDVKAAPACVRLTGIMASMGKATYDVKIMEQMLESGMNIASLNMSFGTKEEHIDTIKMLRQAAKNFSVTMGKNYPLCIAVRLSGSKIRTGRIAETYGDTVELKKDETVRLTTDESYKDRCSTYTIYVDLINLSEQLNKNDVVLLDNESIELKVEVISSTTLTCKIVRGGFLGSYKDVFVPHVVLSMANYSEKDKVDIEMSIAYQVDYIIASFIHSTVGLEELRKLLGERGRKIGIIANIQTVEGLNKYDEILQVADGIMISRQELGSDITPKKLVIAQKNMIARANQANVPIFISAHILSSMRVNKLPLRAEVLDIANCVLDGVDGLVLSPETAVGMYPVDTVQCMSKTCKEAEACVWSKQVLQDFIDKTPLPCDQATGAAMAGVLAAQRCLAAAIVVITTTGRSAWIVAKYRPRCPILVITRYASVAKKLHLYKGVVPLIYEDSPDADWSKDLEGRVGFAVKWALDRGFIRIGDPVVTVSGWRQGTGYTNSMRVVYVTPDMIV